MREQLRAMVEEMAMAALDSFMAGMQLVPADKPETQEGPIKEDLADMLANLDAFQ